MVEREPVTELDARYSSDDATPTGWAAARGQLEGNRHVVLTSGCNALSGGVDLVVEGDAARVDDDKALRPVAAAFEAKYGGDWHYDVRDGAFHGAGGDAFVFEVAPVTAFGFGKGPFSQTRWRFVRQ